MQRLALQIPSVLIAGVLTLDVGLRFASWIVPYGAGTPRETPATDAVTLLCEGDSHTRGAGADSDPTYPAQLEAALRERHPEREWRVLNLGLANVNSAYVARRLEGQIHILRPELVVVWAGANNDWNTLEGGNRDEKRVALSLHTALLWMGMISGSAQRPMM